MERTAKLRGNFRCPFSVKALLFNDETAVLDILTY